VEENRLFIAIDLPDVVKEELERICRYCKKRKLFVGRCTRPENFHLTLKFLGSVSEDVLPQVDELLQNIVASPCKAMLGHLGIFPHRRLMRVLYAELFSAPLEVLAKQIEQSLAGICEPEDREFKNHVTIARIKKVENKGFFLREVEGFAVKPLEFEINEFLLMCSDLLPEGPVYTTLARYRLHER